MTKQVIWTIENYCPCWFVAKANFANHNFDCAVNLFLHKEHDYMSLAHILFITGSLIIRDREH
jgi:hypothetical protein